MYTGADIDMWILVDEKGLNGDDIKECKVLGLRHVRAAGVWAIRASAQDAETVRAQLAEVEIVSRVCEAMSPATFRSIRSMMGISHEELATRFEVTTRTIRRWESGRFSLPYDVDATFRRRWEGFIDQIRQRSDNVDLSRSGQAVLHIYSDGQAHYITEGPESTWAEHTAFTQSLMFALALRGIPCRIEWTEEMLND